MADTSELPAFETPPTQEEALALLKDVQGMDSSWWQALWPWLLMLALLIAVAGALLWFWRRNRGKPRTVWQRALQQEIQHLREQPLPAKEKASQINLALKRAAIAAGYRQDIAPLDATAWFDWLFAHSSDRVRHAIPQWQQVGTQLAAGLYAPLSSGFADHALHALLDVADAIAREGFVVPASHAS